MDKTPLMKRVEAQIGRELHNELKRNIERGHTAGHTAVCLNVSPATVMNWARRYGMRFNNTTPWKDW
jgi:hypothetical protein